MKQHLSYPTALFCSWFLVTSVFGQWSSVAPGIDYREYSITMSDGKPNKLFVARMDRSNQSCIIDSTIAMGQLRTGRETVPGMATRYDDTINYWGESWGQRSDVVVAINGDGYTSSPGPTNGQIISGWQAWRWPEYSGGSGFCYKLDRTCFLGGNVRNGNVPGFYYQFIFFANGGNAVPTSVNKVRAGDNELIVYTPQFAEHTYTDNSGTEVLIEMTRPLVCLPVGGPNYVYGTIKQIRPNAGSTPIPFDHIVLSGTGSYATVLQSNCVAGEQIRFQFEIHDYGTSGQVPTGPSDWTKAYASVGCFAYVVKNGIVPVDDWASNSGAWIRNPRTSVAFNDNYIYFVVCDGRSAQSVGMTYPELGNWLVSNLGAQWATNQDGGGSSTMWVNGQVKNVPSDGSPRAVANGLTMVVVQPKVQSTTFSVAQLVTTNTSSNVRLGPGTNYGILATVAGGTQGQIAPHSLNGVQAKGYYWWKVNFGGSTVGWVAENLLIGGGIAPTITVQPVPQTVPVGGTAAFTVVASGDQPLSYRWQKNGVNLSNGGHYSGVTTTTLTVSSADINDVASYRCVVSNSYGTATSDEALLTLTGQPTITQQPIPQNVCTGGTAVFTIEASGQGTLTYRWQKNDVNLSDGGHYSGSTTPTLTISNADSSDVGSYRCLVTNAAGTTNSNQAPLMIDAIVALVGVGGTDSTITGVSADGTVVAGNNSNGGFIWSVAHGVVGLGTGTSTAGVATKNGNVVVGGLNAGNASRWDGNTAGSGAWTALPLVGGTAAWTPLCTSAQDGSPGNVWVGGNSGSTTGTRQAVRYKESTNSTTALALPPNGNKDAYIYGISDIGSYAGRYQFGNVSPSGSRQAMGGATLTALWPLIGSPSTSNEGVANTISRDGTKAGGWSQSASFSRQGTIWTIANPTVPFAVPFIGTNDYGEVQALNSDGSVAAGYAQTLAIPGSKHAIIWDATNGTRDLATWLTTRYGLDLNGWTLTDVKGISGDGKVIAGNGTYNGLVRAWVALLGVPGQPPTITQHPTPQIVCAGADAAFAVAASGLGTLNYQWQKNGADLSDGGHYSGATTPTLSISGADAGDAAGYRCVVSAGCASAISNAAVLTVRPSTTITQQPTARNTCMGLTVEFAVAATGDGAISYRWQKDGVNLNDGGHYSGTTTATLIISDADAGDEAGYRCVVTAGCGTATSDEAVLTLVAKVAPDLDQDCDVDADDFDLFATCASGPGIIHNGLPLCQMADFDDDNDVDQPDFAVFQRCLRGPGTPADPNCAN
ncbi:MAG TPA: immunoglobulin domain-containing protein [Phycisphaerae bacterium]|nr:immunoglobulin domain-containing protein [Phycisphaerae bacterium]HRR84745.1 immunoglobulin domain-containing protein [Phycisphaerae bacterium]